MLSDQTMKDLCRALAEIFPTISDSRRIVDAAGLPALHIPFDNAAITNWHGILSEAKRRDKLAAVVVAAQEEYPNQEILHRALLELHAIPGVMPLETPIESDSPDELPNLRLLHRPSLPSVGDSSDEVQVLNPPDRAIPTRIEVFREVDRLLAQNWAIFDMFGPESAAGRQNPMSGAPDRWKVRKREVIIPNN